MFYSFQSTGGLGGEFQTVKDSVGNYLPAWNATKGRSDTPVPDPE